MTVEFPAGSRGECRWCHAPVLWLVHERTGKKAPIDAEPVGPERGNITPTAGGIGYRVVASQALRDDALPWHQNHWMTCPQAQHLRSQAVALDT